MTVKNHGQTIAYAYFLCSNSLSNSCHKLILFWISNIEYWSIAEIFIWLFIFLNHKWIYIWIFFIYLFYLQAVRLIVIDEIHLLGQDRGPVLEVVVSRTNFISSHTSKKLRIIGIYFYFSYILWRHSVKNNRICTYEKIV